MKSSAANTSNPRQLALWICYQVVVDGKSLSELLPLHLPALPSERDQGFCSELCYGLCRYYFLLKDILDGLISKPLKSKDRDVLLLLMLGLYQLRFMRVSDHAAVNESVKLLKSLKKPWAKGLVNAVLRGYLRSLQETESDRSILSEREHALTYPAWMRQRIEKDWGDLAAKVLAAGNQRAPMVIRVDISRQSRKDYLLSLEQAGLSGEAHPIVDEAIILQQPVAVERLPGFAQGLVSVQDAAAQLAARLLDVQPGMRILDACAAPGGKTLHILQATSPLDVVALDKDAGRLQRVGENLDRARLSAQLICADAAEPEAWFDGQAFDRILLDAPCSASGIIRRHPDIRLLRQQQDIDSLVQQQHRLLQAIWPLLKPGGLLLYSTCSIFKAENEQQIQRFLQDQHSGVEVRLNTVQWGLERPQGRQILPGREEMDGFYYACLQKQDV